MPTRWETFTVQIDGGLITDTPAIQQGLNQPGSAITLLNFEPSTRGGYRRINGFTKWDDAQVTGSDDVVLGVGFYNGVVIACADDGSVRTSEGAGWTTRASGRTHANKYRFHEFNFDGTVKVIGTDGSNYPFSWDGTTFTVINGTTDVQGAKYACSFKNHLFYSKGNLVTFSAPFDEEDFNTGNGAGSFLVEGEVKGLIVFREQLIIFTENTINALVGSSSSDFVLQNISNKIGCIQDDTVKEVGGDVAFFAADGIRLIGATDRIGDFNNLVASRNIQREMDIFENAHESYTALTIPSKSQYRVFGYTEAYTKNTSEGFVGTQFQPQDAMSFQWARLKGFKVYSADSRYYNGDEYVVFSSGDGYVYRMDSGTDFDGEIITASFSTPFISLGDPTFRKTIYSAFLYFAAEGQVNGQLTTVFDLNDQNKIQPETIDISFSGGGFTYGSGVFGTALYSNMPSSVLKKQLVGSGYNVSFQFDFNEASESFSLDTLLIDFKPNDKR